MEKDIKKNYFETQWGRTFSPPKDVQFVVYSREIWNFAMNLLRDSKTVVDLGAGGGTLLYNVQKITKASLIAVDISNEALRQLRMMVPKAKIVVEDVTATSLNDESCDFCLSSMVIEHVDDNKIIKEVYRILHPGGYFLITSVLKAKGAWYFYKNKDGMTALEPSHLREYTSLEEFIGLLTEGGFKILKVETPRIKFPLVDPLFKTIFRASKSEFWGNLPTTRPMELIRKIARVPIPGYYAIEVVAQKIKKKDIKTEDRKEPL